METSEEDLLVGELNALNDKGVQLYCSRDKKAINDLRARLFRMRKVSPNEYIPNMSLIRQRVYRQSTTQTNYPG